MKHHKLEFRQLLIYIISIAFLTAQAQSFDDSAGDPLNPGILGESMSMPLPLEMIHAATNAGIAKDSKALYAYDDGLGGYVGSNKDSTYKDSGTTQAPNSGVIDPPEQSVQNVNVTGSWSLDLKDQIQRHLDLSLVQNREAVLGHGTLDGPNGTQRVTVSGSMMGGRLGLTAMLIDSLDLYKLNLSINSNTNGTYTAYSTSGATWSGDVSGSAPSGISNSAPKGSEAKTENAKEINGLGGLADLGQRSSSASSSTSIGMSSASGGTNSVESYSSTSESAIS